MNDICDRNIANIWTRTVSDLLESGWVVEPKSIILSLHAKLKVIARQDFDEVVIIHIAAASSIIVSEIDHNPRSCNLDRLGGNDFVRFARTVTDLVDVAMIAMLRQWQSHAGTTRVGNRATARDLAPSSVVRASASRYIGK